jgi:hypothetical protein
MHKSPPPWNEANKFLISGVANHLVLDLDAWLRELYARQPGARMKPSLATALLNSSARAAKAQSDIVHTFEIFGLILVREAERLDVPLPVPSANVADWLVISFLPAYKAAFPDS